MEDTLKKVFEETQLALRQALSDYSRVEEELTATKQNVADVKEGDARKEGILVQVN